YDEAVKPATDIQREVLLVTLALIIFSIPVSAAAARLISQPIFRLSETAQQIEESVEKDNRAALQNMRLPTITGTAEVSQLISVFGQMVGALLNRMRELDTIYAIGQTITANLDHEAAMQSVLDAVRDVVDYDAAEIAIIEGDQLTVYAWNGKRGFKNTVGNKYKVGVGITGKMAETKKPVYIPTITEEENDTSRRTLASNFMSTEMIGRSERVIINSYLGIPLLVKDEVIGVLTMVHHEPNHFTEDDQRQINKLSAQASIAIYNSLRVRAREDELKNRIRELQIHVSDAQSSRESETLMNAQYFQSLREQARKLRLRRKKDAGEDTEVTLVE
ncbi:MAG: GAF domain-containing protein, partial [Anaerolineales bacterium]|nr:GAF domain-containing protein [Anaerolineales bacterium]